VTDPALDFWLRHVAFEGGLHEPSGDAAYVVLPPALSARYRLPEELRVTADPDVARDDGVTLLALGHPVLSDAAERVLGSGDAGTITLSRPAKAPPGPDVLLAALRESVVIDHGRVDATGDVAAVTHPVVRVGAMVTYELSAEDHFQEQAERWIDGPSRRVLPPAVVGRLARASVDPAEHEPAEAERASGVWGAIAEAHRLIDEAAAARRSVLAAEVNGAYEAERERAAAYYADAIAAIERRLATAAGDRQAMLGERLRGTREEQARRLAEIAEKYAASHVIRPYRVHVIAVPALRVPADVRRGDRRYPMTFDWLLPAGTFAPVRCPSCGGEAPLVAGKQKLGCETCLPARPADAPSGPPAKAVGAAKVSPAPTAAPARQPGPARTAGPARQPPVPPRARPRERRRSPEQLAEELWVGVARGLGGDVSHLLEPGSPAAVLYRVFGSPGLTQVIGMSPGVPPYGYTAGEYRLGTNAGLVAGTLTGTDESEHPYFLSHRGGLAVEVLPCPVYASGELWNGFWMWQSGDESWSAHRVPRSADADPVETV